MSNALIFFLLALPALAPEKAAATAALSACGPGDLKFDVKLDRTQPVSGIPCGKALVYVVVKAAEAGSDLF